MTTWSPDHPPYVVSAAKILVKSRSENVFPPSTDSFSQRLLDMRTTSSLFVPLMSGGHTLCDSLPLVNVRKVTGCWSLFGIGPEPERKSMGPGVWLLGTMWPTNGPRSTGGSISSLSLRVPGLIVHALCWVPTRSGSTVPFAFADQPSPRPLLPPGSHGS